MKLQEYADQQSTTTVGWMDCWYEMDDGDNPIIYLSTRTEDGNHRLIEVEGYEPYLVVKEDELDSTLLAQLDNDPRINSIIRGERTVHGEAAVKITTQRPWDVRDVQDEFDLPYESDVQFDQRFLVDVEQEGEGSARQKLKVPLNEDTVTIDDLAPADDADVTIEPRICWFDIEVEMGDGVAVVSEKGTELTQQPVTAITAIDSYEDGVIVWLLENDAWDVERVLKKDYDAKDIRTFESDEGLLNDFCAWVDEKRFDVLSGWNSSGFDVPYIVNRLFTLDNPSVYKLSPTRNVSEMDGEGVFLNSDLKGVICLDLLEAYDKTTYGELDSYKLADVAEAELDVEKLDIDLSDAWTESPRKFIEYAIRDTELLTELNDKKGIL